MNPRFCILAMLVSLIFPVFAQDKPQEIRIRPVATAISGELKNLKLRAETVDLGEISLETNRLGKSQSVSFRQFAFGLNEPDGSFRSLGTIALPEVGNDFILVFAPKEESYQVFVIRSEITEFVGDDVVVFNFTTMKIRATFGEASKEIKSNHYELVRPKFGEGDHYYTANLAYERNEEMSTFNNSRWPVNPNLKTLIFVDLDPKTQHPIYRVISMLAAE